MPSTPTFPAAVLRDPWLGLGWDGRAMGVIVGILANLGYPVRDTRRVTGFGCLVTTAVGVAATVRIWQVFRQQHEPRARRRRCRRSLPATTTVSRRCSGWRTASE